MRTYVLSLLSLLAVALLAMTLSTAPRVTVHAQTRPADGAALLISEIMYNPPDFNGYSGDDLEFIELYNRGDTPADLSGMAFTTGIDYTFAQGASLAANDYLVLAATPTAFLSRYGFTPYDAYSSQLDNGGETLILRAADGAMFLSQPYDDRSPWPCGADGSGFSLALVNETAPAAGASWRLSTDLGGSPAAADPSPAPGLPAIVINEILAHTDLPLEDAVELYNPGEFDAYVGNWFLSDKPDEPRRIQFENDAAIPAGGYLVINETAFGGFGLSENGETVLISSANCDGELTGYRKTVTFEASPNGVSLGRYQNSVGDIHFPLQITRTLGADNAGPSVGPVVISEIMYNPPGEYDEYIELTNISDASVALHHPDHPQLTWWVEGVGDYSLPTGISVPAHGRLLITPLTPRSFRAKYNVPADVQIAGPYQGELNNGGERITIFWPGAPNNDGTQPYIVMDSVKYDDGAPWPITADGAGPALTRRQLTAYGDDPVNWRASDEIESMSFLPIVLGAHSP